MPTRRYLLIKKYKQYYINNNINNNNIKFKDSHTQNNGIQTQIGTYYSGLNEQNPQENAFKIEMKNIRNLAQRNPHPYSVEELNEKIAQERKQMEHSRMKIAFYQWFLNKKDKTALAWKIVKEECDYRADQENQEFVFESQAMDDGPVPYDL